MALAIALPGTWLLHRSSPRCREVDEARARADFAAGRTVLVDGWVISVHESDMRPGCSA
jgi:hypothetical protein